MLTFSRRRSCQLLTSQPVKLKLKAFICSWGCSKLTRMFLRQLAVLLILSAVTSASKNRRESSRDPKLRFMLEHYGAETKEEFQEMVSKAIEVKKMLSELKGEKFDEDLEENKKPVLGDIILDVEFSTMLIEDIKQDKKQLKEDQEQVVSRTKRSIYLGFAKLKERRMRKWVKKFPFEKITYKFDGLSGPSIASVEKAMEEIKNRTCVRFLEIKDANIRPDIVFANEPDKGCLSCIGHAFKGKDRAQPIYLEGEGCTGLFGIPLHEILHALGAIHEQQRPDRSKFIKIIRHHIEEDKDGNFFPDASKKTDFRNSPYDFSSVMHYEAKAFGIFGTTTILTKNRNFLGSIGQRAGMSFHDARALAYIYCNNCDAPFAKGRTTGAAARLDKKGKVYRLKRYTKDCIHTGYKFFLDRKSKCVGCFCPDGFTGRSCGAVDLDGTAGCLPHSGIHVTKRERVIACLTSPGYGGPGYKSPARCNWLIFARNPRCRVSMYFKDDFGIYCRDQVTCEHWVEVKVDKALAGPGFRFCCGSSQIPTGGEIISEGRSAMVTFRSDQPVGGTFTGFQLCYYEFCN